MSPPLVVSQEAEDSCRLLNESLAAHRIAVLALRTSPGASARLTSTFDRQQVQRQSTIVRLMSITESFVTETLRSITDPWSTGSEQAVQEVWSEQVEKELSTWDGIEKAYSKRLGVDKAAANWQSLRGYVQARNAVTHGLGTLTRRQNTDSVRTLLDSAGITRTPDHRIELDEAAVTRTADVCRALIENLDLKVPR